MFRRRFYGAVLVIILVILVLVVIAVTEVQSPSSETPEQMTEDFLRELTAAVQPPVETGTAVPTPGS